MFKQRIGNGHGQRKRRSDQLCVAGQVAIQVVLKQPGNSLGVEPEPLFSDIFRLNQAAVLRGVIAARVDDKQSGLAQLMAALAVLRPDFKQFKDLCQLVLSELVGSRTAK